MLPEEEKENTKIIEYRDQLYKVPVWVKFVVTEANGLIIGFEFKPFAFECLDAKAKFWIVKEGRHFLLPTAEINWKDSLRHYE